VAGVGNSYQLSAISYQLSAISYQPLAGDQTKKKKLKAEN
jgi:hypothetical protein